MSKRKEILQKIIDKNPEARETKNKYRAIKAMALYMFPQLQGIEELEDILYEVINADRDWRKLTEEFNQTEKQILSQEWQLENGYEVAYSLIREK